VTLPPAVGNPGTVRFGVVGDGGFMVFFWWFLMVFMVVL